MIGAAPAPANGPRPANPRGAARRPRSPLPPRTVVPPNSAPTPQASPDPASAPHGGGGPGARTAVVVGAGPGRAKFGNKSLRAHAAEGWRVVPVHPTADAVEGVPAVADLAAVPAALAGTPVDRVTLYVPPAVAGTLLEKIAALDPAEVWFNPGTHDPAVRDRAAALNLPAVYGCSIVNLGRSPAEFPDE